MSFPVHPAKVLRLFAPLWMLLALSLWLHWQSWQTKPILFAAIAFLPLAAAGAAGLMRERWRLELTADALVHHTLGRAERFEWARMGPLTIAPSPLPSFLFVQTFWFAFPLDAPRALEERASQMLGRRILCVFGDLPARETTKRIEEWRALYAGRSVA
ncbi:hypothetical protein U91I_03606 [alpha proteobacterium U9-1i]|nr:hypothetical protein U91I_03606 [alpha proteobacterium U9-1i]